MYLCAFIYKYTEIIYFSKQVKFMLNVHVNTCTCKNKSKITRVIRTKYENIKYTIKHAKTYENFRVLKFSIQ